MRPFIVGASIFLLQAVSYASTEAVMPIGALPKNSSVKLQAVKEGTRFITPQYEGNSGFLKDVDKNSLYQVTDISGTEDTSDNADLQALAKSSSLVVQKSDLGSDAATCSAGDGTTNCTLTSDVPAYKTGSFNLIDWFLNLFGLGSKPKSLVTPSTGTEVAEADAMASAMTEKIDSTNRMLNSRSATANCDEKKFPEVIQNNKTLNCGLKQAMEALKKNKGKVNQDKFIFNDFSDGGVMGKMWILNADGSLANVVDKNPLWVSRGEGGFGNGRGSLKTPNGAIMTKAYSPPRGGNIRDGIELLGLEPENQDIHGRGVLLHGWDPYTPTQGCLGVAGSLDTVRHGRSKLGTPPPYLDQLKQGFLKEGGTMIYNFTPSKAKSCQ
ncbi:hypothetical protein [Bdellovibrio bacteriovorus]|uniref:YkuD domain-containing protein n=1 Tax=Bdellovibrio bacteriovorus TaxID=959 RepID=A0A1Z3N4G4_BDEBC|nr:hypothetical protein [Bdellovibrio bacteriovorus]ASD62359.1 hypothetical protein B9G79_01655 [Bdellovibrio bacteriovorus]